MNVTLDYTELKNVFNSRIDKLESSYKTGLSQLEEADNLRDKSDILTSLERTNARILELMSLAKTIKALANIE